MSQTPQTSEEKFLRKLFSEHYQKGKLSVVSPEKREFGFGGWEKKIEFRHIGVKNEDALRAKLVSEAPLYVSHSVGYYEFPDARPMVRKNWLGADLVFDLDADGSACASACGKFTCEKCLTAVKGDALKLIEEFLLPDFGFSKNELSVNFSGSRGYHVHVRSEAFSQLDRDARREIADYVTGTGLSFSAIFSEEAAAKKAAAKRFLGPLPTDGGYKGRIARAVLKELSDEKSELPHVLSIKLRDSANREKLARSISAPAKAGFESDGGKSNWDAIGIGKNSKERLERFQSLYEYILKKYTLAGKIDSNVTADTSKLIRMADSIHGGSGLAARSMQVGELATFDPMKDAQIFTKGALKVKTAEPVPEVPHLVLQPLEKDKTIELPMASAVYLLCKKAAIIA